MTEIAWKKTQQSKCYLSMSMMYKEGPHWYSVTGYSHGGWRSLGCWAGGWKKVQMSYVCRVACFFSAFNCWVKYFYPWRTHFCSCGGGWSSPDGAVSMVDYHANPLCLLFCTKASLTSKIVLLFLQRAWRYVVGLCLWIGPNNGCCHGSKLLQNWAMRKHTQG